MTLCPQCRQRELVEVTDIDPTIKMLVCPSCTHYESTSEAYKQMPRLFNETGKLVLQDLDAELAEFGLNVETAQAWAQAEPSFTKRNFTPLDAKRRLYRT